MEAYLDERYGLADPVLVQYGRWLARVSPIKFGPRDLVAPDGEVVRRPGAVREPPAWRLFADALPRGTGEAERSGGAAGGADTPAAFARLRAAHATARAAATRTRGELEAALVAYARAAGLPEPADADGRLRPGIFEGRAPRADLPEWAVARIAAEAALSAFAEAERTRGALLAAFDRGPLPSAGFWVLPGLVSVASPDLGVAFSKNRPVSALMAEALPVTLLLNLLALPFIYLVAIPGGALAAARAGTWVDGALGGLFVALWSVPAVWAGVLAVGFLASERHLGLFPASGLHAAGADAMAFLPGPGVDGGWEAGYLLDLLWHVCLPVACLAYGGFAVLSKQTRAAMLETMGRDHVRTARAKGLGPREVLLRHVLRNSLLPLITMFVSVFPAMLSGSVVIERVFSVPGMGSLMIDAIQMRDREVLLAGVLMVGGVNVLALLLADVLYAAADPRVTLG
ncbi:MAG: ABC transporter permease [Phycisphaerae bacterium]|nr:ABC transporter permease [Phycisphaerae bacterium]